LVNIFVLIYFLFEIISRIFAIIPEGAFIGLKRLLLFLIFYVSLIKITDEKNLYRILLVIIIIFSLISTYEVIRYIITYKDVIKESNSEEIRLSYFAHPLTVAEMKLFLLLSILPVLFTRTKIIIKSYYIIILSVPIVISMLLTQSRNVILALFVCLVVYGFFNRKFLIAFILFIILAAIFVPGSYKDRVTSIFDPKHPSNESRLMMWETGFKMFKDHPLTGVGDNEITKVYEMYKPIERHGEGAHLHSNFMMILATTGIFGFISYICFFLFIFIKQINIYRIVQTPVEKNLVLGSILTNIGFQIAGFFEWTFGKHHDMTIFFFLIAIPFIIYKFYLNKKIISG